MIRLASCTDTKTEVYANKRNTLAWTVVEVSDSNRSSFVVGILKKCSVSVKKFILLIQEFYVYRNLFQISVVLSVVISV